MAAYVGWLSAMIHASVGIGATALIARAVGGQHRRLANAAVGQSLILAMLSGLAVGVAVFAAAPMIGVAAGRSGQSLALCTLYLRIVASAAPLSAILMVGSACLRGAGDTRSPFVVMTVVNAINIGVSYLLVFGPGAIGGHGVGGIAIGTTIAWGAGAILILVALSRKSAAARLHRHRLAPHAHTLRRITRVGVPNLLESVLGMWLGYFLVLMIVGRLGDEGVIGAHMIAVRIESMSFLSGYALSIAAATLTGQYLGLGDVASARRAGVLCWTIGAGLMSLLGVIFFVAPRFLGGLITDSPILLDLVDGPIRICGADPDFFRYPDHPCRGHARCRRYARSHVADHDEHLLRTGSCGRGGGDGLGLGLGWGVAGVVWRVGLAGLPVRRPIPPGHWARATV